MDITKQTTTVHAGETLNLVLLNEPSQEHYFIQEAGSHLRLHILHLYSAIGNPSPKTPIATNIFVEQTDKGCQTEIYALAYLAGNEQVSLATHMLHSVGEGKSQQLLKFVLAEQAKGEFLGELKIAQDAQQTEAHQTNRNLLLSEQATMRTRPQLEIYADDVQATHGATTGQLDDSALFYMMQRGIDEPTARRFLVQAFMKDVLETITDQHQREQLMQTIDGIVE